MEISEHGDGEDLLENVKGSDVIILDVEMPGLSGIDVKEELQWDTKIVIIFVTAHEKMYGGTHGLNVYGFVWKAEMEQQLTMMLTKLKGAWCPYVILDVGVDSREIEYVWQENIYALCHMVNGDTKLVRITLRELEEKLAGCDFFRIHRGYLINLRYIRRVKRKVVVVGSREIPVSARKRKSFLETYDEFCRKNARFG